MANTPIGTRLRGDEGAFAFATGALSAALLLSALAPMVFEAAPPTTEGLVCVALRIVVAAAVIIAAVLLRDRLPAAVGWVSALVPAVLLSVAPVFGTVTEHTASGLRELAIIALYLGWFFPPLLARLTVLPAVLGPVITLLAHPAATDGAEFSPLALAETGVLTVLCLELGRRGSDYYRRRADADQLTGVLNRRGVRRTGADELQRARRQGRAFTAVLIDADRLKSVNDVAGHEAGDEALRRLAQHLSDAVRAGDAVGRVGGDEFVLLLAGADDHTAQRVMARVRGTSPVAFSYGIAQSDAHDDLDSLLRRADERMYDHKS